MSLSEKGCVPGSEDFLEHFGPIAHRLTIHFHNDMADNGRTDAFVGRGKMNVGIVAAIEFQDGPDGGAHLLALHVSGVTGDAQRANSYQRRDNCVVSAGAAPSLLFRHEDDASFRCAWVKPVDRAVPCSMS